MATTIKVISIVILAILGLSAIGGGFLFNNYVDTTLQKGVKDTLVIDKNFPTRNRTAYLDWLTNTNPNDAPKYKSYYFWNLTNPVQYLDGDTPQFQQIGPYVYRQYDNKFNVSITDTAVSYNTWTRYVFQPSKSFAGANPLKDKIVNVNPSYLGVLSQPQFKGSEAAFITAFVGPTIDTITQGLTGDFAQSVIIQNMPTVLEKVQAGVVSNFYAYINSSSSAQAIGLALGQATVLTNQTYATELFFNSTEFQSNFSTLIVGISEFNGVNLSISAIAADRLLNTGAAIPGMTEGWLGPDGYGPIQFLTAYQAATNTSYTALTEAQMAAAYDLSVPQLQAVVNYLLNYMYQLVVPNAVQTNYNMSPLAFANYNFYAQWANTSITTPLDLPYYSQPDNFEVGAPSGINLANATALWDSNSGVSITNEAGLLLWFSAAQGNKTAAGILAASFPTIVGNQTLLTIFLQWLAAFKDGYVTAQILPELAPYGISTLADIGYFQWGNSSLTTGVSVKNLDPHSTLPGAPEFWAVTNMNLSLSNSIGLLTGMHNLTNSEDAGFLLLSAPTVLAEAAVSQTTTLDQINGLFGTTLNVTEFGAVIQYIQYIMETYVKDYALADVFANGGGLITTRTPNQWLWSYNDPLLLFLKSQLDPSIDPAGNLFANYTSYTDVPASDWSSFMSGANNISSVMQYISYHGMTKIANVWRQAETITGTDATQFHPGVTKTETLKAFVSDLLRVVKLQFSKEVTVRDINTYEFTLSPSVLAINSNYYQTVTGLANMTSANDGLPLYLSKPAFLDANQTATANLLIGVKANRTVDDTIIDVEPVSGTVLNAAKRLQINFLVKTGDYLNPDVETAYIPLLWVQESGQLTQGQSQAFRDAVYSAQKLANLGLYAGPTIGVILLLSAVSMAIDARKP